jgi:N-acetylglucosaminyldiphosphoundecaprenol N-acetyl-beta-D-mannosaminyltransferase
MVEKELATAKREVLGLPISTGSFNAHVEAFADLGAQRRSAYVCCVNAHMTVEAWKRPEFSKVVRQAAYATADGVPVLRALQLFHRVQQQRVAGNDIMPALLAEAEKRGLSVFFYGSTRHVLDKVVERCKKELPNLRIAGTLSPPFNRRDPKEVQAEAERIEATRPNVVMVALGCPKQEEWMATAQGTVNALMLGLGGAFLLYAGLDSRAPKWMRDLSLEWTYRLWLEPRRLWKRYLVTNSLFLILFSKHLSYHILGRRRT